MNPKIIALKDGGQNSLISTFSHEEGKVHEPRCLVDIYKLYIRLAKVKNNNGSGFYFRPNRENLAFDKSPVGVNTLIKILPSMQSLGFQEKTSHSLRVMCATTLFQSFHVWFFLMEQNHRILITHTNTNLNKRHMSK